GFDATAIAAGAGNPVLLDRHVADLAGIAAHAPHQLAADHHAAADAGAREETDQVLDPLPDAAATFPVRDRLHVVEHRDRQPQRRLQALAEREVQPVEVWSAAHHPGHGVDLSGDADADRADGVAGIPQIVGSDHRGDDGDDVIRPLLRLRRRALLFGDVAV